MDTLAIVFAILALVFVLDLARIDQAEIGGYSVPPARADASAIAALGSIIAAVVFGVMAAV